MTVQAIGNGDEVFLEEESKIRGKDSGGEGSSIHEQKNGTVEEETEEDEPSLAWNATDDGNAMPEGLRHE